MTISFLLLCIAAEARTMHWTIDTIGRHAIVFMPTVATRRPPPLLIVFHGHGGDAAATAEHMNFQSLWPEAVVVYPQGLPTVSAVDAEGKHPGWQREPGQNNDRDLKLFDAIVESFPHNAGVYVAGFSNGAFFSYLLWSERASTLKGVGICAAKLTVEITKPVAVIHIAGKTDPLVKIDDQMKSIDEEARIDGSSTPHRSVIHAGGHVWPPWAARRIVQFFKSME
jgi:polyhydroxybutyrate depolymerase